MYNPLPHSTAWYNLSRQPFSHLARLPVHLRKVVNKVLYAQLSPPTLRIYQVSLLFPTDSPHLLFRVHLKRPFPWGSPQVWSGLLNAFIVAPPSFPGTLTVQRTQLGVTVPAMPAVSLLHHGPIVAWPTEPRAQPTMLLRGQVVVGLWAGLSLCGCGVLTEAQLEEAEHLSGSPEGPPRAEVGTRQRPRWPSSPFSSSTGNSSNLSTRFSSSYSAEAAMGSTSSLRRS